MDTLHDINIHLENKKESRHFFVFLWIMYALVYMTKNCFSSAMASIVAEGVFTKSQVGLITSLFYLVYAPFQIFGGFVADKKSPEMLIKIGLIGGGISNLVIFFNQNYYVILVSWVFNGIVQFALWPSVFKIVSSQLVRSDRGNNVFLITLASSGGLVIAFLIAAIIPKWQYTFAVSSATLFLLALILHLYCKHLDPYMKKDYDVPAKAEGVKHSNISNVKLFLMSGFFVLLPTVLMREIVNQGSKTMSPTMLMESYAGVSDSIGNLLNILIILAGILGTFLIKFVFFGRIIKNEVTGLCALLTFAVPFAAVLIFVGDIPVWLAVLCFCCISTAITGSSLLQSYYNVLFTRYGKNGTVAGIANAAASAGIVIQSYGLMSVSENFGWSAVSVVLTSLLVLSALLVALAIIPSKKFKRG
ncbi:MAG: MFS transporter [Ruminococcaceae bacterium]|nr:MFS transporter [Oscillospiraceae bacterium]